MSDLEKAPQDRLLSCLMRGEEPKQAADLDEVCEMLAADDGGRVVRARVDEVADRLHDLNRRGVVRFTDTGRETWLPNPLLMHKFSTSGATRSATRTGTSSLPEVIRKPIYAVAPADLAPAQGALAAVSYWPRWATQWCGAAVVDSAAAGTSERVSKADAVVRLKAAGFTQAESFLDKPKRYPWIGRCKTKPEAGGRPLYFWPALLEEFAQNTERRRAPKAGGLKVVGES